MSYESINAIEKLLPASQQNKPGREECLSFPPRPLWLLLEWNTLRTCLGDAVITRTIHGIILVGAIASGSAFAVRGLLPTASTKDIGVNSPTIVAHRVQQPINQSAVSFEPRPPAAPLSSAGGQIGIPMSTPIPAQIQSQMQAQPSTVVQSVTALPIGIQSGEQGKDAQCRQKLLSLGVYLSATDPCIDIDELIKNLATGNYSFNRPASAYVGDSFTVVLTLQTAKGQDVSGAFFGTTGPVVTETAHFAQHLEAVLRGGVDFAVDPDGPQDRIATTTSPVIWQWTVTPRNAGKKTLNIAVTANLMVRSQKEPVPIRTLSEEIQISVGFLHMFVSAFSSLWGLLGSLAIMIIAVLGVIHAVRSLKHPTTPVDPPIELATHHHSESSHTEPHSGV